MISVRKRIRIFPASLAALTLASLVTAQERPTEPMKNGAITFPIAPLSPVPLAKEQVIDNLVRKNQERAQALLRSESTRIYHLTYRGLGGDHDAEMTVEATYESPATRNFKKSYWEC